MPCNALCIGDALEHRPRHWHVGLVGYGDVGRISAVRAATWFVDLRGRRRSEEVREGAETVREIGLTP